MIAKLIAPFDPIIDRLIDKIAQQVAQEVAKTLPDIAEHVAHAIIDEALGRLPFGGWMRK